MEIGLLGLIIVIALAIYFKKPKKETESSQELLLQLNEALRKEIQEIRKEVGENLIVYIAEVTEKILMEEYFIDPEVRQDKIYNFVDNEFIHYGGPIHNSPKNWKTDISGIHCLISKNFWYFGEEPLPIPEELNKFYYPFIGEKKFMELQKLKNYMQNIKKGVYAKPFDK